MGKSHRHILIAGIAHPKSKSEEYFKRRGHHAWRRAVKQQLHSHINLDILPLLRECDNIWTHPKDGKMYYGNRDLTPKTRWWHKWWGK